MDKQKSMINSYKNAFETHGDSELSLQWSKSGQQERLQALVSNLDLNNSTILDFGCGLAHLKLYLKQNYSNFNYHGVDIVEDFISFNKNKYKNDSNVLFNKINTFKDIDKKYDFIFISGVFNILIKNNFEEQFKYIQEVLKYMFSLTNITLSVNFMNHDVDFIQKDSYHQDVVKLYEFVTKNLSKRVIIDQSYMPYEFTMKIYKIQQINKNIY